jgi:hypothetical protein
MPVKKLTVDEAELQRDWFSWQSCLRFIALCWCKAANKLVVLATKQYGL